MFGGPRGGRGRGRARRGDVRLALLLLLGEEPRNGYQLMQTIEERSDGRWRPSPGSVYPTLQQLQDEGLVTVSEEDGRRTFSLTDAGRAEVERASAGRRAPWEDMADEADDAAGGLKSLVGQLIAATIQVATAGTHDQVAEAEKVLTDARRAMYRLLAEDEPKAPKADA
jgi:DNA-binding PadR family transcriptional regulator